MGIWITDAADILRAAGLDVVEVPGWKTRGYAAESSPGGALVALEGGLVHHTATPATRLGDLPTLDLLIAGRVDVPGPLAQLGLGRSGTWYPVAAGRANHSGAVDDPRYSNPRAIGVEAEHPGGTVPWPEVQYDSYIIGCAALQRAYNLAPWRGHKEAAVPYGRKPDPNFDMTAFRTEVARILDAGLHAPEEIDVLTPAEHDALVAIRGLAAWTATTLGHDKTTPTPLWTINYKLDKLLGRPVDEPLSDDDVGKIAAAVLAGLPAPTIADAVMASPDEVARAVVDILTARLAA